MTIEQVLEEQKKLQVASLKTIEEFSPQGKEFIKNKMIERKLIIDALEKQVEKPLVHIPQEVEMNEYWKDKETKFEKVVCPVCNCGVGCLSKYCGNCGQRIKTEEI